MRVLRSLDVLGDEALASEIARWSFAVLAVTASVAVAGAARGVWTDGLAWGWWLATYACVSALALPVHELVHALFFRLAGGPGTRVRLGVTRLMLYASCPGLVLSRGAFVWVVLAPAVLLSAAMGAACQVLGLPLLGLVLVGTHLAGCTGDALMAWAAVVEPGCAHVRDTERGVDLLD